MSPSVAAVVACPSRIRKEEARHHIRVLICSVDDQTLVVRDITHGLPEIPGKMFQPRPAEMMPAPIDVSDATLVSKTFQY